MIVDKITSHLSDAVARLITQYKDKPNMVAFISTIVGGVQALEDAIYALDAARHIYPEVPVGAQLDQLGVLIGLRRNGLADDIYYRLLLGTIAENFSDGTEDAILNVVQSIYGATSVFLQTPQSPGGGSLTSPAFIGIAIGSPTAPIEVYPQLLGIVQRSLPAGITLSYIATFDAAKTFAMDGPQSWVAGFGDADDPTVGGGFADLIYTQTV